METQIQGVAASQDDPLSTASNMKEEESHVSRDSSNVNNQESHNCQDGTSENESGQQPADFQEVSLSESTEVLSDTTAFTQLSNGNLAIRHEMNLENIRPPTPGSNTSQDDEDEDIMYSIGSTPSETPSHKPNQVQSPQPSEEEQKILQEMEDQNQRIVKFKEIEEMYQKKLDDVDTAKSKIESELEKLKNDMRQQQEDFAQTIQEVKSKLNAKADQAVKQSEAAKKDLESMVMKYAMSEKHIIEARRAKDLAEHKMKEYQKENDALASRVKSLTADKTSLTSALDRRILESANLHKELDKLKEDVRDKDHKLKHTLHKLKVEENSHAEVREQLLNLNNVVELLKQEIVITKSTPTPEDLSEDFNNDQEGNSTESVRQNVDSDMMDAKKRLEELLSQNSRLKIENESLQKDRDDSEQLVNFLKRSNDSLKESADEHVSKISALEKKIGQLESCIRSETEAKSLLELEVKRLNHSMTGLNQEVEMYRQKEAELSEFMESSMFKSTKLQSEYDDLKKRFLKSEQELKEIKARMNSASQEKSEIQQQLMESNQLKEKQINDLMSENQELKLSLDRLKLDMDERENDQRVMAKKHNNLVKELNRELNSLRKKLESYESSSCNNSNQLSAHHSADGLSLHSRTSSSSSFEGIPQYTASSKAASSSGESRNLENGHSSSGYIGQDESNQDLVNLVPELDKQRLVERIIKLQKTLATRNEKIDFLEDHSHQLVEELKKKTRLIQHYMLREEAGALSTSKMDQNKVRICSLLTDWPFILTS